MQEQLNQIIGYLHGMWRYRWSALLISWVAGMVGIVTVLALPNKYEAKAVIYIDTTSIMKPLLKGLAVDTDDAQELYVINRILLSRENLLSVIRETDMDLKVNTPRAKEDQITDLAKAISLKGGGNKKRSNTSSIYEISYQSPSSQLTYQVVSVLLNTMVERLLNSSRTDTVVAEKFLNNQIKEYETRLSVAEKKMAAFKKQNIGMMPDERGGYYVRLQTAQDKVESIRADLRLARQRHSELIKQMRGEVPVLVTQSYATAPKSQLRQYQEQLVKMLTRYTDAHPDVLALKATIADLKKNEGEQAAENSDTVLGNGQEFNPVYQELKLEVSRASVEAGALKLRLFEQEQKVSTLKGLVDAIPNVEAKLAELNRDYEITRERYLQLVSRRESARMAQVASQSSSEVTVRIIEPPVVPVFPIGPNRPLLLLAALVVALGVGLGWCVLRYMLAPTIINAQQLSKEVEYPVFGVVSYFITPGVRRRRWIQLTSFLLFTFLLAVVYSGVLWKQEEGTALVKTFITNNNPKSLIMGVLKQSGLGG